MANDAVSLINSPLSAFGVNLGVPFDEKQDTGKSSIKSHTVRFAPGGGVSVSGGAASENVELTKKYQEQIADFNYEIAQLTPALNNLTDAVNKKQIVEVRTAGGIDKKEIQLSRGVQQ